MAPSPVTPSPHRFLINRPTALPPAQPVPLSNTQTQRFKETPRFSFAASQRLSSALPPSSPSLPRFNTPAHQSQRTWDSIEDLSDEPELGFQDAIEETSEHARESLVDHDEAAFELQERLSKRRRVSSLEQHDEEQNDKHEDDDEMLLDENEELHTSSIPILSSPPIHQSHQPMSTPALPRFLPPSTSTSVPNTSDAVFLKAPKFVPSEVETNQASDPLPNQFSPHRRGQKYLTGGLAAELQGWLVEIENSGYDHAGSTRDEGRTKRRRERRDAFAIRLVIDECKGGTRAGMVAVRGRQVHSLVSDRAVYDGGHQDVVDHLGIVECILAGEGVGEGLAKGGEVKEGSIIGIKPPVWEVTLKGRKVGVGVNWRVLG